MVDRNNSITYYIPVYCRLKVKNVTSIDYESLSGTVNVDIIISVYYGGLGEKQKSDLKEQMCLMFPKDAPIKLKED
jgi:hypothetical protein